MRISSPLGGGDCLKRKLTTKPSKWKVCENICGRFSFNPFSVESMGHTSLDKGRSKLCYVLFLIILIVWWKNKLFHPFNQLYKEIWNKKKSFYVWIAKSFKRKYCQFQTDGSIFLHSNVKPNIDVVFRHFMQVFF